MTFWLLAILATALAAIVLVRPLLRSRAQATPEAARGLAIYRDQLAEVDRDQAANLISEAEAAAAKTEIERRILRAAEEPSAPASSDSGVRLFLAGLVLGVIPAGALAVYLAVGSPGIPGPAPEAAALADETLSADALADLARAQIAQNRAADAVETLARATAKDPRRADLRSLLGEARVAAADGRVTDAARQTFRDAIEIDAHDPRARFYLGLAKVQDGDPKGAIDDWLSLEADSASDAPWRPMLAERLAAAATESGIDLDRRRAERTPRGPTGADVAAAQQMSPADRQQMVRGMVEGLAQRLEANPGDVDGWLRLGRSRGVLGEEAAAIEAFRRAALAAPGRVDVLIEYAHALHPPGSPQDSATPEFTVLMRRILALDPENAEGLFFVGEAEARAGNTAEARALWGRLLARIDPKEPLHTMIAERLQKLAP